jgi:tetratricopeptide (TPR) repeat protein
MKQNIRKKFNFTIPRPRLLLLILLGYGTLIIFGSGCGIAWEPSKSTFSTYSPEHAVGPKPAVGDAEKHLNQGNAYFAQERYQEAIDAYKQAIQIEPDYAEAHYYLGLVYGKQERYQEAINAFKQAIQIKPDYAEAHYYLGLCYVALGDRGSALEEYKILKTLDQNLANKLYNLANKLYNLIYNK